ncbi:MAG: metal-sensitive transcriptional regulator [Patescibacteria group bacterium]|nr:metal-sensitive transcriptional regulator [Patescibacteria group bacterium]MDD5715512.1 metal-sensitive transcriptional regulator [Patescibacteria group bacterium]
MKNSRVQAESVKVRAGAEVACDVSSIQTRLNRVRGQVDAIGRMLGHKNDCFSVLQQLVAARKALDKVAVLLLEKEAHGCFPGRGSKTDIEKLRKIIEAAFKSV